jgi:hypothetical protein
LERKTTPRDVESARVRPQTVHQQHQRIEEAFMYTILIAHRDAVFAEQLSSVLRNGGYRVISCPGPWPPVERCIRSEVGYCPLTEGADMMIYDPALTALDAHGERYNLALDSALAHPEIPMLLAWSPAEAPDLGTLRAIRQGAPHVHAAAQRPAALLQQIRGLLAPPSKLPVSSAPNGVTSR